MDSKFKEEIKIKEGNKPLDEFTKLNDMFSYGIDKETAHIHMPDSLKDIIKEKRMRYTTEYVNEKLFDALQKLVKIASKDENIKKVFAVSPLLESEYFRERLEIMGFKTEAADKKFEEIFPNHKSLYQCSIPIERLRQTLSIEQEAREAMDTYGEAEHSKILYYKYEELKKIGIIDYYKIPLDKIVTMGTNNYNYRHGILLETKEELDREFDLRIARDNEER